MSDIVNVNVNNSSLEIAQVYANQNEILKTYIKGKFTGRIDFTDDSLNRIKLPSNGKVILVNDDFTQVNADLRSVIMGFKDKYNIHIGTFNSAQDDNIKIKSLGVALSYYYFIKLLLLAMIHLQTKIIGATANQYAQSCKQANSTSEVLQNKVEENERLNEQLRKEIEEKHALTDRLSALEMMAKSKDGNTSLLQDFWSTGYNVMKTAARSAQPDLDACDQQLNTILSSLAMSTNVNIANVNVKLPQNMNPPTSNDRKLGFEDFKTRLGGVDVYAEGKEIAVDNKKKILQINKKIGMLAQKVTSLTETNAKLVQLIKDSLPLLTEFSLGDM